ncbi:MAG: peptidase M29 [Rhodospirillaceae bacterium]|nr:peptidase M29 [Rhodospirillaceae bacterium]|tara:strand:+ start:194 stop:1240 length:1047 start_codon:yes stop_codon:yes gene_type:complete
MMPEAVEAKWIDCFRKSFEMSGVSATNIVAILSESQSRQVLVDLSELALLALGARPVHIRVPSPKIKDPVPVRSTGSSYAMQGYDTIIPALSACDLIIDCTVEGMLHSRELQTILASGGRVYMISNEHPEILERCMPNVDLRWKVEESLKLLDRSKRMEVSSKQGTHLLVEINDAPCRAGAGYLLPEEKVAYWPAGLALFFPLPNSVNGQVVLAPGDVNLTFKRYFENAVTLIFENDFITDIKGDGLDADLMRSYYEAWGDQNAYAISHVGWGLNKDARWDSLVMYDKQQINGTELRAFAGNFLISTGANEYAKRHTSCHFDLPMRGCSIRLDGEAIVKDGKLCGPLS